MGIEKRLEAMAKHYGYPEDLIDPCGAARDALSTIRQLGSLVDKQKTAIAQARAEGERAGIERAQAPFNHLIEGIQAAITMLGEHIDEHWDFEFEPHNEPAELSSLRRVQHHLIGTLIDKNGEPIRALKVEGE